VKAASTVWNGGKSRDYIRGLPIIIDNGYPVDEYPKYPHHYEDGRIFPTRAYPNELLGELRKYFVEVWLKSRAREYFGERDPRALPYLDEFLSLPNLREAMGYIESE